MLEQFVERIAEITRKARSETSLQVKLEPLLTELLAGYGIPYEPAVDERLNAQGLSRVDSTRPDSLFGQGLLR